MLAVTNLQLRLHVQTAIEYAVADRCWASNQSPQNVLTNVLTHDSRESLHVVCSGEARPPPEVMTLLSGLDDRTDPEYEKEFLNQAEPFNSGSTYITDC